jgi:molybdate transport system substrate-binding protein
MDGRFKRMMAAVAIAATVASGCGAHPDPTTQLTVYAASSLVKSFTAIGRQFEAAHPEYTVVFVFASSSELSSELADGADADVFASGERANMTAAADSGAMAGTPVPFASNWLVGVTAPGNPKHLGSFADLAQPGLRISVCGTQGACGSTTQLVEQRTGVQLHPQRTEPTPSHVLSDVANGSADAGVVFTTDALAAGDNVSTFPLPEDASVVTSWIGVVKGTTQERGAALFVGAVTGAAGRQLLAQNGFGSPLKDATG